MLEINSAFQMACRDLFCGRGSLVAKMERLLGEELAFKTATNATTNAARALIDEHNSLVNLVLVSGEVGCGKTTLLASVFAEHRHNSFFYAVGSFSGSESTATFLKLFIIHMSLYFGNGGEFPLYNRLDIDLVYASNDLVYLRDLFAKVN